MKSGGNVGVTLNGLIDNRFFGVGLETLLTCLICRGLDNDELDKLSILFSNFCRFEVWFEREFELLINEFIVDVWFTDRFFRLIIYSGKGLIQLLESKAHSKQIAPKDQNIL